MTIDWVPAQLPLDTEGRRIVDTALGILIGLRRCSSDAAFQELHDAAQRHRIPAFPMAWALVHLAGRGAQSLRHSAPLNTPRATNGGSCSRHPPRRPVDRQSEMSAGLEIA
jgi:hypothetical protein